MSNVSVALRHTASDRRQPASPLVRRLQELVEALDRRVPQIERAGEVEITADARRLRAHALERLALLRSCSAASPS